EYPAPIGTKSETYYWLIKYETRAIEDSLKGLLEDIPIEEQLQQEITRNLLYGIHLKEESRVSRLMIIESPEDKQIDEDCYVLGFFETYNHQLLSNLADLYQLILPEKQFTHLSIKLHSNNLAQISKTNATINSLTDQIKRKKVSLFELRI